MDALAVLDELKRHGDGGCEQAALAGDLRRRYWGTVERLDAQHRAALSIIVANSGVAALMPAELN